MGFDYGRKIQALLANAENESLPDAARQSYRDKAEELMKTYRVAEEHAMATEGASINPIRTDIRVTTGHTAMTHHYERVWSTIARHCGVRYTYAWDNGYVAGVVAMKEMSVMPSSCGLRR